ncbi:MAG: hypothetical protein Q4F97_04255 [Bacteroidales bacterium]|nr:hypothetical protein [Bacteroidales bacterium]
MITENFKVGRAFGEGWKLMKKNWIVFIGLMLGLIIVSQLIGLFAGNNYLSMKFWIVNLITMAISAVFSAGMTKMYLTAVDGNEPEFSAFKEMLPRALPYFITNIIVSIFIIIGFCLFIVPGIFFAARLGFATTIIIDKPETSIIGAIKESINLTKGNSASLMGLICLSVLTVIGGVILLIVGMFPAAVWVSFTMFAAYRMLKNGKEKQSEVTDASKTEIAE